MGSIWYAIRLHFGFEATGVHFFHFSEIHLEHGERPEDLYQRLMAFTEDNLLRSNSATVSNIMEPSSLKMNN